MIMQKKEGDKKEDSKGGRKVDTARKYAQEITNELIEYTQRCEFEAIDKTRFTIKAKNQDAEVFFLKDTFLVQKQKIQKVKEEKNKKYCCRLCNKFCWIW